MGAFSTEWGVLQNGWKICLLLLFALFLVAYCLSFSHLLVQTKVIRETVNQRFSGPLLSHLGRRRNENWTIKACPFVYHNIPGFAAGMAESLWMTVLHVWWDGAWRGYCRGAPCKGPDRIIPLPGGLAAGAQNQLCNRAAEGYPSSL